MENSRLLIMVVKLTSFVLDDLDLVALVALISTGVEKSGVFVTLNSCPDFISLFPQKQLGMGDPGKNVDNECA